MTTTLADLRDRTSGVNNTNKFAGRVASINGVIYTASGPLPEDYWWAKSPDGRDAINETPIFYRQTVALYALDFSTALTVVNGLHYYRVPDSLSGRSITGVSAQLGAAQSSSGTPTVQITRLRASTPGGARAAVSVLSTALTIDVNEWDSSDSATPAVVDASNAGLLERDLLRVDVTAAGTGAQGLFVTLEAI